MKSIFQALLLSIVIIAVAVYLSNESKVEEQNDLNIVLISVDTVRPDHLSTYGYNRLTDPNLRKLADKATVYKNAFTMIPQTYPSFAMLFTGKSPLRTGVFSNPSPQNADRGQLFLNTKPLGDETETLASILKMNGYKTAGFVTSGILHEDFTGLSHGFDSYQVFDQYDINAWKQNREGYDDFIDKSSEWFSNNKHQKFFYWIHLMDPHSPYYPPDDVRCLFQSDENCQIISNRPFNEINSFESPHYACSKEPATEGVIARYEALYDAEILSSDRQMGKILAALKKNNLMENTLIIYYGDHGESFDHQYYFAHGESLYDSTIRIPLVIYNPLQQLKKTVMTPITNVDILPTILDLVHIPYTKSQFDGKSLVSKTPSPQTVSNTDNVTYFSNYNLTKFAVMKGQFKYIVSLPDACLYQGYRKELYNLAFDPDEQHNLYGTDADTEAELEALVQTYLSEMKVKTVPEVQEKRDTVLEELKSLGY